MWVQYEWNARTQVTMWYDNTKLNQSQLHDYGKHTFSTIKVATCMMWVSIPWLTFILSANKFWSGLLKSYYLPRASMYFRRLSESLRENKEFKVEEWRKEWIAFSNKWQAGREQYLVKAKGNALALATDLYKKYLTWSVGWGRCINLFLYNAPFNVKLK